MTTHKQYTIGIDLGGTRIKAALINPAGEIQTKESCPTDVENGENGVADRIAELVNNLCKTNNLSPEDLAGVGIGVPGVTTAQGVVVIAPNLHWHHVPFKEILEKRLGLRVEIDNDASVAALGEAHLGVGAGCESLFLITLGTGIGGGIILNGTIHHGASFSAGEIGHMCLEPHGPVCGCGKKGCLEALTAGPAMVRFVQQALQDGQPSILSTTEDLTPEAICNAAEKGDGPAQGAVAQSTFYLGIAVANIINVISPNVIAIGGGISAAGDLLLKPIIKSAHEYTLEGMFESTRIVLATLGNDAGVMGASRLVV